MAAGRRSKTVLDGGVDLGRVDGLGAEGLDQDRDRVGHADGVGDLDLAAAGGAGGDHVLGDPAGGVGGRAVDLGRVLAGEGAAAVAGHAAVGVDDDLATGEAGVADGTADDEAAGRVDEDLVVVVGELLGDDRADDVLDEVGPDHRCRGRCRRCAGSR